MAYILQYEILGRWSTLSEHPTQEEARKAGQKMIDRGFPLEGLRVVKIVDVGLVHSQKEFEVKANPMKHVRESLDRMEAYFGISKD